MVVLRLLATCAVVSAIGCGGSSIVLQSNDAGGDGDAEAADAADDADALPTLTNEGVVSLTSVNATTKLPPTESSNVYAGFTLAAASWCSAGPMVDGCSILDCKPPFPQTTQVGAGSILVNGGKLPLTLTTTKQKGYGYSDQEQLRLWDGGEALQVVVAGDVAPAFSLSLIAPAYVLVDAPTWPTGGATLTISRAAGLYVSWSGGGAGSVLVRMILNTVTGSNGTVTDTTLADCQYPAQTGFGKVSAKVLGMLPTGATTSSIEISSSTVISTTMSGWRMTFSAVASANTPTGLASAPIVLQ